MFNSKFPIHESSKDDSGESSPGQSFVLVGSIKYSISICSNSLDLKRKFRGAISFLKDFPIWAIPNGSFNLALS